eukprot:144254-Chlamydomonas_euryale.AAC.4
MAMHVAGLLRGLGQAGLDWFHPMRHAWMCPCSSVGFPGSLNCAGSELLSDRWPGSVADLALAVAGVANVVQPCLVCDWQPGSAVDSGLGLVKGALCNDYAFATEDVQVIASRKASATAAARRQIVAKVTEGYGRPPGLEEVNVCIHAAMRRREMTRWRPPF